MTDKLELIKDENISSKIYNIRGLQVMLDRDLAVLYQTETRTLKQTKYVGNKIAIKTITTIPIRDKTQQP